MRAVIAVVLAVSACPCILVACTDDTAATPTATAGAVAGGTPAREPGNNRAPSGCQLETTDYRAGAKAENVPRGDVANTADWSNVEGALSDDGKFATVTLGEGQESSTLRVSHFGFRIPDTAETWGIEVELKRRAPNGGVEDSRIDVEIEGKPSRFKYIDGPWPKSIVGTHAYGQAVDTWGVDLFPADANKSTFAAKLTVKRTADAPSSVTANVDSLKIAVHFCPEPIKR